MASDDMTSQDSAVIGDDLVEALGFEPISADGTPSDGAASGLAPSEGVEDGNVLEADGGAGEVAVLDEVLPIEPAIDIVDDGALGDGADAGPQQHDDEIDVFVSDAELVANGELVDLERNGDPAEVGEAVEDEAMTAEVVDAEPEAPQRSIFDTPEQPSAVESPVAEPPRDEPLLDEPSVAESSLDEPSVETDGDAPVLDAGATDLEVSEVEVSEVEVSEAEVSDVEIVVDAVPVEDSGADLQDAEPEEQPAVSAAVVDDSHGDVDTMVPPHPDALDLTESVNSPGDDITIVEDEPAPQPQPTNAEAVTPSRRRKIRARKSRRVVRHIDPWSVLTFSVLFHLCLFSALLLSSVLVWNVALAAGAIENTENFIRELGDYDTFQIHSDQVFRAAVLIAGMLTLASSVMVVLLTVVFNLISDLIGGIRVTVIEEETVRLPPADK